MGAEAGPIAGAEPASIAGATASGGGGGGRAPVRGDHAPALRVEVVLAHAGAATIVDLELPAGASARDAILAAAARDPAFAPGAAGDAFAAVAIWNHACRPDTALADGDRVELLRPLTADPKAARRRKVEAERAAAHRTRWRPDARGPVRAPGDPTPR